VRLDFLLCAALAVNWLGAIVVVLVVSAFVVSALFVPRFIFVYHVTDRGLLVKLLGLVTLHRVWWSEIVDVKVVPASESPFYYSLPRYLFSRERVVVRLRKGIIRNIVLSPRKPDVFASQILERVKRSRPEAAGGASDI
jgi:hypothetical protein